MGLNITVGCVIQQIFKAGCRIKIHGQNCNNFHFVARIQDEKIIFNWNGKAWYVCLHSKIKKAYFGDLSGELKTQVGWNTGCCAIQVSTIQTLHFDRKLHLDFHPLMPRDCKRPYYHNKHYFCCSSGTYSTIDDDHLDELVQIAANQHPGIGIRMLKGYLQSQGFRIQRERIRLSLLRTDPIGLMARWRTTTRRRQYNVRYPLSLWHIDGNHKLIR